MMDNWVKKVSGYEVIKYQCIHPHRQIGYPVVTVTEKDGGIHVRQDRLLETGPADPKDNETIWCVCKRLPVLPVLIIRYDPGPSP